MAAKPAKDAAEAPAAAPKKSKMKLIIMIVVGLAAAGGGAAFFMGGKHEAPAGEGGEVAHAAKAPVFYPLETFTVNLKQERGDQYLQMIASLQARDNASVDTLKQYMPEVRHRVLLMLTAKKATEISTPQGRELLAEEMRQTLNNVLLTAAGKPALPIRLYESAQPAPEADAADTEQAAEPPVAEGEAATPAATVKKAALRIARPKPEDPIQSVYFTSFIIQ